MKAPVRSGDATVRAVAAAMGAELGLAAGADVDVVNPRLVDDVAIYERENV